MRTKLLKQKAQESFRKIMESEYRNSTIKGNVGYKEPTDGRLGVHLKPATEN
jgi:hypothetical protein